MTGMIKGLAAVVAMVAMTACSDANPTGSSIAEPTGTAQLLAPAPSGSSTLTFSSTQSGSTQSSSSAVGGLGYIDFTGSLQTPNPCYNVSATHTEKGTDITVTVSAVSNGNACIQVITNNNYQGRVSGLAGGTYNFTVVHNVGGRSSTAFTRSVVVL